MRYNILILILYLCTLALPVCVHAFDCVNVDERYNEKIREYSFKEALDLLAECAEVCQSNRRDFCASQSVNLKATIRNYVDLQINRARKYRDQNPGASLRAYERVVEIASAYPEKTRNAVQEAKREMVYLRKELDNKIDPLLERADKALNDYHFDTVRDIIYEIYTIDHGNAKARELSERAVKRVEDYIENEQKELDKLLSGMVRDVERITKEKNAAAKKKIAKQIEVTNAEISDRTERALTYKAGESAIIQKHELYKRTVENAQKKGVRIVCNELPTRLTESQREKLKKAIGLIKQGNYSEAINILDGLTGSIDRTIVVSAYMYQGIAYYLQTSSSERSKELTASIKNAFENALHIERNAELPSEFKGHRAIKDLYEKIKRSA